MDLCSRSLQARCTVESHMKALVSESSRDVCLLQSRRPSLPNFEMRRSGKKLILNAFCVLSFMWSHFADFFTLARWIFEASTPHSFYCARRGRRVHGQCMEHWPVYISLSNCCIVVSCGHTHRTPLTRVSNNNNNSIWVGSVFSGRSCHPTLGS